MLRPFPTFQHTLQRIFWVQTPDGMYVETPEPFRNTTPLNREDRIYNLDLETENVG
jgi:hypothetical protein